MPIFIYGCNKCDSRWEDIQIKTTDEAPTECPNPKCSSSDIEKRPTTQVQVWGPNDGGHGGWTNQNGMLVRVRDGNGDAKYGDGHV